MEQQSFSLSVLLALIVLAVRVNPNSDFTVETSTGEKSDITAGQWTLCRGDGCYGGPVVEHGREKQHIWEEHEAEADREPIIYSPEVTINEPATLGVGAGCNRTAVQDAISSEVARLAETYSRDEEEMKRQVLQLQAALSEFASNIKKSRGPKTLVSPASLPRDCSELLARGMTSSGSYVVQPTDGGMEIGVYCDMETDGGGWTVFQRRRDGSVDFYRVWASYRQGFGDLEGEFWLGNDNLHRLTAQGDYELRVDLTDFQGNSTYADYNSFSIADMSDYYRLTVGGYSGTAGDSLASHNGRRFSTRDVDKDDWSRSCAREFRGAWWYAGCYKSHLNGQYFGKPYQGVAWFTWKNNYDSLRSSEMKFRKKNF